MNTAIIHPTTTPSAFDAALSTYVARRDTLNGLPHDADQASEDSLADLLTAAERRLIDTPTTKISDIRAIAEMIWCSPDAVPDAYQLRRLFEELRRLDDDGPCRTFNAAHWLAWFERNGGGWIDRDGEIILVAPANGAADLVEDALWYLETRDGIAQVKEHIRNKPKATTETPPTWEDLLRDYRAAKEKLDQHCALPSPTLIESEIEAYEAKTDGLTDTHSELMEAIMLYPSPNAAAVAFKMRLFAKEQLSDWHRNHEFSRIIADEAERLISQHGEA